MHDCARFWGACNIDSDFGWQCDRDLAGQGGDIQRLFRTNVISPAGFSFEENRPEPDHQVGSVKIRPDRRTVALHLNRVTVIQTIVNEIADSKMRVEGHVRADEGEAARDRNCDSWRSG